MEKEGRAHMFNGVPRVTAAASVALFGAPDMSPFLGSHFTFPRPSGHGLNTSTSF